MKTAGLKASVKRSRWKIWGWTMLLLVVVGFWIKAPASCAGKEKDAVKASSVEHQLCSAEEQVPFTRALSDLNREDPEVMSLPAITPARCLTLEPAEVEFGRPFMFSFRVSKEGFKSTGTITLRILRIEEDGWERVRYWEEGYNSVDGSYQGEGLLWCKNGQCHGVGKDAGGRPLATRLLLRKVIRM